MRPTTVVLLLTAIASPLKAQGAGTPPAPAGPRPAPVILPAALQIAAAIQPLPAPMRDSAAVLGYGADGRLVELRHGSGSMICLADDPKDDGFHVACYSASMEAFMARGRELRAQGANQFRVASAACMFPSPRSSSPTTAPSWPAPHSRRVNTSSDARPASIFSRTPRCSPAATRG